MFLQFVPLVGAVHQILFQHLNDPVLVFLVHPVQVLLAGNEVFLRDHPAPVYHVLLHIFYAFPHDAGQVLPRHFIGVQHRELCLPGEGLSLLPEWPHFLDFSHESLENAAVEDSSGLLEKILFLAGGDAGELCLVLVDESCLPVDELFVADNGLVFVVGHFEIPEEPEVFHGLKSLIVVHLIDNLLFPLLLCVK